MEYRGTGAAGCAAVLLTLAACGTGSDDAIGVADEPVATASPSDDGSSDGDFTEGAADEAADPPADDATDPTLDPEPDPGDGQDAAAPATTTPPAPEAPVSDNPDAESPDAESPDAETGPPGAAAPVEPVVGGRLFAAEVRPEAELDSNPFPDLVVDDIGKDADVNIRNILPSDRPVLLWAWAPH